MAGAHAKPQERLLGLQRSAVPSPASPAVPHHFRMNNASIMQERGAPPTTSLTVRHRRTIEHQAFGYSWGGVRYQRSCVGDLLLRHGVADVLSLGLSLVAIVARDGHQRRRFFDGWCCNTHCFLRTPAARCGFGCMLRAIMRKTRLEDRGTTRAQDTIQNLLLLYKLAFFLRNGHHA